MRLFIFSLTICVLAACQPSTNSSSSEKPISTYQSPAHHTELLSSVFDAHGGYEQWSNMKALSYSKGEEETITNLVNRKIRVSDPQRTIGYDGNEVWISPDSIDASRARFYHNLYFYFYAMPFVVGDPGAFYEEVPSRQIQGKNYRGIKVSYNEGVGDASDDNYILWIDPETSQMEWLMYTVTYRSQEPSEDYRLIKYDDWQTFSGVKLPTKLQWYNFEEGEAGEPRGDGVTFENIELATEAPADSLFEIPSNAVIAPR